MRGLFGTGAIFWGSAGFLSEIARRFGADVGGSGETYTWFLICTGAWAILKEMDQ